MRYRLFSGYEREEKNTHFGYKRVSEREKTQKGRHATRMCIVMCVILLVDAHWTVSYYGQTKIPQLDFQPLKFIWKLKQVESAGNFK